MPHIFEAMFTDSGNSKDLVTQLTNQIIEDIDDEVRQLVLDAEKRIKEQQEDNFTERQVDCN